MAQVLYEKRNGIGYITLNRPHALNALDDELNNELWAVWNDFATDQSVHVAILTGAGKAFCSGADLKTFIPKWEKANMLEFPSLPALTGLIDSVLSKDFTHERGHWKPSNPAGNGT